MSLHQIYYAKVKINNHRQQNNLILWPAIELQGREGRRQRNLLQHSHILWPLLFEKNNTAVLLKFRQTCPTDFSESYLQLTIIISLSATGQGLRSEIPPAWLHSSKYSKLLSINIFGFALGRAFKATCLGTATQSTSALQPNPNSGGAKGRNLFIRLWMSNIDSLSLRCNLHLKNLKPVLPIDLLPLYSNQTFLTK